MSSDDKLRQLEQREAEILAKLATCEERQWPAVSNFKVPPPEEREEPRRVIADKAILSDLRFHGEHYRG